MRKSLLFAISRCWSSFSSGWFLFLTASALPQDSCLQLTPCLSGNGRSLQTKILGSLSDQNPDASSCLCIVHRYFHRWTRQAILFGSSLWKHSRIDSWFSNFLEYIIRPMLRSRLIHSNPRFNAWKQSANTSPLQGGSRSFFLSLFPTYNLWKGTG